MNLDLKDKKNRIGFSHAWNGIIKTYQSELNFRIHIFAAIVVILFGILLRITSTEWVAIVFAIGFVLTAEMINSVVETMIDYIKPEYHPKAGYIKDAAAGAVLISAMVAVIIGCIIFIPRIYELLFY